MNVVIADPDPSHAAYLRQLVSMLGHDVVAVGFDAIWATTFARTQKPGLVLMHGHFTDLESHRAVRAIVRAGTADLVVVGMREWTPGLRDLRLIRGVTVAKLPFTATSLQAAIRQAQGAYVTAPVRPSFVH